MTELIIALDFALDAWDAVRSDTAPRNLCKIGPIGYFDSGFNEFIESSYQNDLVFLDAKLLDIPKSVAGAVKQFRKRGFVEMFTVHAQDDAMKAAVSEKGHLKALMVSLLTSIGDDEMSLMSAKEFVLSKMDRAVACGMDGLVCSVREAAAVRRRAPDGFLIVTPGVRLPEDALGDHKRSGTPQEAVQAGVDYVVVGEPIFQGEYRDWANNAQRYRDALS